MEQPKKLLENKVSYTEPIIFKIAKVLKHRGYGLADSNGVCKFYEHVATFGDYSHIGIIQPRALIKKGFLGIEYKQEHRLFVGCLDLNKRKKWILEVYGRENVSKLMDAAKKLSKLFDVKIKVNLETEFSKDEGEDPPSYYI